MKEFEKKLFLIKKNRKYRQTLILELGVRGSRSTKMFLETCDKNDEI